MTAAREAGRQQRLLQALDSGDATALAGWLLHCSPQRLRAYRANAAAIAERALAAAHPTLQQLLGAESFAALARAHWHAQPPVQGDVAEWGSELANAIAADRQLADVTYLADVARLDWAVHQAERAADAALPQGLDALADGDPAALRLVLAPGTALLLSSHPVVTLWHAHRSGSGSSGSGSGSSSGSSGDSSDSSGSGSGKGSGSGSSSSDSDSDSDSDRLAPARAALARGRGETARVRRRGWQAEVAAIGVAEAAFTAAALGGRSLGQALDAAGPDFAFEAWLVDALGAGAIAGVAAVV